ncbi:MAG: hypothetical protein EOM25_07770 [Deltaproteobacteria bacterium]|nr:hypothetical protein [Deltaproteobacteria bacterium]
MNGYLEWAIVAASIGEVFLLILIVAFYRRLGAYRSLITELQTKQQTFVERLEKSSLLERQMMATFEDRQQELSSLDIRLTERARELKGLLEMAQGFSRSPAFLRQTILAGHKRGRSLQELARATGLSREEVELILDQSQNR